MSATASSALSHTLRPRFVLVLLTLGFLLNSLDRVLYLGNGRAALGTVDEVITRPVLSRLYGSPIDVMRVVLDTNILISACLKPDGLEAILVEMVLAGLLQLCVSRNIVEEYVEVFTRPKFAGVRAKSTEMLRGLLEAATLVTPTQRATAAADEDDNRFLECAAAGGAHCVLTGNLRHFPAEWRGIRILNARRFFDGFHEPPRSAGAS